MQQNYITAGLGVCILFVFLGLPTIARSKNSITDSSGFKLKIYPEVGGVFHRVYKHRAQAFEGVEFPSKIGFDFRLIIRSNRNPAYKQAFAQPMLGLGYFYPNFNHQILGDPNAIYGFIEYPFSRFNNQYFSFFLGSGVAFGFKPFDWDNNPRNLFIGTCNNYYGQFEFRFTQNLNRQTAMVWGFGVRHFSNGSLRHPNIGVNLINASMAFRPSNARVKNIPLNYQLTYPKHALGLYAATGFKHRERTDYRYSIATISAYYSYALSYKSRVGLQADFMYDGTMGRIYWIPQGAPKKNVGGVAIGHDLVMGPFTLGVYNGIYVFREWEQNKNPWYYQRIVLKTQIHKVLHASVAIKSHLFTADYIEWGVGYHIPVKNTTYRRQF